MSKEDFSAAAEGAKVPKIQRFESAAARVNIPGEVRPNTHLEKSDQILVWRESEKLSVSIPIESAR